MEIVSHTTSSNLGDSVLVERTVAEKSSMLSLSFCLYRAHPGADSVSHHDLGKKVRG